MHGKFLWYDLMTTDPSGAARFYGDVVGWETQASGTPGKAYTLFTIGGAAVAGLMPVPPELSGPGARPRWTGYIAVDDVDLAVAKIQETGGSLHRPAEDVPGVIRFAVVGDPQGAVFLVAKGLVEDPPPLPPEGAPGTVGWRELYAAEWTGAFAFYQSMFGWTKSTAVDMGAMGTYQLFGIDGVDASGMMTKPDMIPMPHWGYYFNVRAIDAAAARVTAGGGTIFHGPVQVPGGQWIIQALDPQGAAFSLVAPAR